MLAHRHLKIRRSIHWTILRNFNFPSNPPNSALFKAITYDRKVHAHLRVLHAHIAPIFFVHSQYLIHDRTKCVTLPKLCARHHFLSEHAHTNINNQLVRPILTTIEIFIKIRLHLTDEFTKKHYQSVSQSVCLSVCLSILITN